MVNRRRFNRSEERLARQFLRRRNLLSVFNRFRKLKGIKKKSFTVSQDNVSQRLIAHKKGDRVIVRDAFSLRILATSKKFNLRNIQGAFSLKDARTVRFGKNVHKILKNRISLREITRVPLTNVVQIDRSSPLKKRVGKLFINATFTGKKGEKQTVEAGSRALRLLNVESEKVKAFNEAYKGALGQVTFYPVDVVINWIHFSYFIAKKKPQPIFQFEKSLKAV